MTHTHGRLATMAEPLVVTSYGGGVQSTAMLVLTAQGYLPPSVFLFSNVGDDSEHPATLDYVRGPAWDYAAQHGIEIHELHWVPATTAIGISTDEYTRATSRKREPFEELVYPLLTIEHRLARPGGGLDRSACARIIADAGLPVPPKSSCYFCPFHKPTVFADMARDEPDLFEKSAHLEDTLNARRATLDCPGAGSIPLEASRFVYDVDENDDLLVERIPYDSPDGQGACPSCRSRQPIVATSDGPVMADHMRGPVYLTRFGKPLRSIFGAEGSRGIQGSLLAPGWDEDEGYRCGDVCDT